MEFYIQKIPIVFVGGNWEHFVFLRFVFFYLLLGRFVFLDRLADLGGHYDFGNFLSSKSIFLKNLYFRCVFAHQKKLFFFERFCISRKNFCRPKNFVLMEEFVYWVCFCPPKTFMFLGSTRVSGMSFTL